MSERTTDPSWGIRLRSALLAGYEPAPAASLPPPASPCCSSRRSMLCCRASRNGARRARKCRFRPPAPRSELDALFCREQLERKLGLGLAAHRIDDLDSRDGNRDDGLGTGGIAIG